MSVMQNLFINPEIIIYVCDELLDEFTDVSSRLKIRIYITDKDIMETLRLIDQYCFHASIAMKAISSIRDEKDLYLLSLADTIFADFILTGDKHLLSLQTHNQTRIVTYKEFAAIIKK